MKGLESAETFDLPDQAVWLLGDIHGNTRWLQRAFPAMRRVDASLKTVLQLGDWWQDSRPADHWASVAGIDRILVTLGNHEPYGEVTPLLAKHPGRAVRISESVWLLPPTFRFSVGGRTFLSVGGATSADIAFRTEGVDWWAEEAISALDVEIASRAGPVDVVLSHEAPDLTPVVEVRREMEARHHDYGPEIADAMRSSRQRLDRVIDAVQPRLHAHGHLHVAGQGVTDAGRRVVSMGRDSDPANIARLNLATLDVRYLEEREIWHRRH